MKKSRGAALLLLLLCAVLLFPYGRAALLQEAPPAFFVESAQRVWVGLGEGFLRPGVHQFSDGTPLSAVIKMTGRSIADYRGAAAQLQMPLQSGELFNLVQDDRGKFEIQASWLPAGQRVALGIPLHPDRMSLQDWEFLPGIGPALALAIETDRQKNGDFGRLETLQRVRGVGPGRIRAWREFF